MLLTVGILTSVPAYELYRYFIVLHMQSYVVVNEKN